MVYEVMSYVHAGAVVESCSGLFIGIVQEVREACAFLVNVFGDGFMPPIGAEFPWPCRDLRLYARVVVVICLFGC